MNSFPFRYLRFRTDSQQCRAPAHRRKTIVVLGGSFVPSPSFSSFQASFSVFPHIESRSHPSILCMSQHVSRGPTPRLLRLWPMPLISDRMRSWLAPITVMWWGSISRFVSYLEFQRGRRSHVPRTVQTRVSWSGLISDPQQRSWAHP